MHRLTLNISDNSYEDILNFLKNYKEDIEIIEEDATPDFIVKSLEEAKKRVYNAEKNVHYTAHDAFCKEIDQFTKSL
jgi:hypothetical protein